MPILQIMNWTDYYLKENVKKVIGSVKDESDGKIMRNFTALRPTRIAISQMVVMKMN